MSKSDRRYLRRAVGHPLARGIPQVLSDARLSADAKLVYLALLSLSDPSGRVQATEQEIARRVAAIRHEFEWGDSSSAEACDARDQAKRSKKDARAGPPPGR